VPVISVEAEEVSKDGEAPPVVFTEVLLPVDSAGVPPGEVSTVEVVPTIGTVTGEVVSDKDSDDVPPDPDVVDAESDVGDDGTSVGVTAETVVDEDADETPGSKPDATVAEEVSVEVAPVGMITESVVEVPVDKDSVADEVAYEVRSVGTAPESVAGVPIGEASVADEAVSDPVGVRGGVIGGASPVPVAVVEVEQS